MLFIDVETLDGQIHSELVIHLEVCLGSHKTIHDTYAKSVVK